VNNTAIDSQIVELFNESLRMEGKVASLYRLFARQFPEDRSFWDGLSDEEEYHAAVIQSGRDYFFADNLFPLEALEPNLLNLRATNTGLDGFIEQNTKTPPLRSGAFMQAMLLEGSSGEYYFQLALDIPGKTSALQLLRTLAGGEKNHAQRIFNRFMGSANPDTAL
jgi:hypothetical protein